MPIKQATRWQVFTAGFIVNFFTSSSAIFSVVSKPMTELYGWSMTDFSLAFSIHTLFFAILGIFSGRIADTCGAKKNMYVGAVLYGVGWFFTSRCETLTQLYLVYGVIAGSGGGTIYNAVISTTLRWFPDIRGKVSGFLLAASALGPFTLAPLSAILVQKFGIVQTFEILGVLFLVAIAAVGWMIESAPADYKPAGWSHEPIKTAAASSEQDYEWKEMLSTPLFYGLLAIYVCASTAGTMMINSASIIAQTQIGVAATVGALIVSVSTLSNFVGRLSFGVIYDKISGFKSLLLSFTLTIIALMFIGGANTMPWFIVCVILLGFAFGGLLVVFPPIVGKYFGIKNLGVNYGIIFLGYAGGSFIGPRVSSYFLDTTGSFSMAYITAAALALLGAALVVVILIRTNEDKKEYSNLGS